MKIPFVCFQWYYNISEKPSLNRLETQNNLHSYGAILFSRNCDISLSLGALTETNCKCKFSRVERLLNGSHPNCWILNEYIIWNVVQWRCQSNYTIFYTQKIIEKRIIFPSSSNRNHSTIWRAILQAKKKTKNQQNIEQIKDEKLSQ